MPNAPNLYEFMHHARFWIHLVLMLAAFVVLAFRLRVRGGFLLLGYLALQLFVSVGWYARHVLTSFDWFRWDSSVAVASAAALNLIGIGSELLLLVFALVVAVPAAARGGMPALPPGGPPPAAGAGSWPPRQT